MGSEVVVKNYKLNTGALMPAVGLGVTAIKESHEETKAYVLKALQSASVANKAPAESSTLEAAEKLGYSSPQHLTRQVILIKCLGQSDNGALYKYHLLALPGCKDFGSSFLMRQEWGRVVQVDPSLRPPIVQIGYRLFDTAKFYNTEASIGDALQEAFGAGIVHREEVFLTTKIWMDDMHPPEIIPALRESLIQLKLDYVDLCLVHWPLRTRKGASLFEAVNEDFLPVDLVGCWKALEQAVELGLAKAIGVSNFSTMRLKEIESHVKIVPAVNQMEMHPGCEQAKVREFCNEKGILVTAWSPLGAPGSGIPGWGTNAVLDSPILKEIAEKHQKTVAQVALRWVLEKGAGVTVKSSNPERMAKNLELFDWSLSPEDHKKISGSPPFKLFDTAMFMQFPLYPYKSLKDMWDD